MTAEPAPEQFTEAAAPKSPKTPKTRKLALAPEVQPEATPAPEAADQPVAEQPKPVREKQNGVTRPKAGGACAKVWDALDRLQAEAGDRPLGLKDARALAEPNGWSPSTCGVQFYAWREFNKGR
jgi:hypothetical protein